MPDDCIYLRRPECVVAVFGSRAAVSERISRGWNASQTLISADPVPIAESARCQRVHRPAVDRALAGCP